MNQKGFANIALIVVIVAIIAVGGYFVFVKKSAPIAQQPTPTSTQTETPVSPTPAPKNETAPQAVKLGKIPESAEIIYRSNGEGYIYVMDRDGKNVTQVTFGTPRPWEHAAVSFDRRYIVGNEHDAQTKKGSQVWVFDLEKGTEAQLLPDFYEAGGGGVDWSPDGFIYFAATPKEGMARNIYKIKPDGSGLTQLTHLVRKLAPPQPELAVTGDVSVSADGANVAYIRQVLRNKNSGKIISDQPVEDFVVHAEVWVMNADGRDQQRVHDGGNEIGMYGYDWIGAYDPEVSPDGKQMVFSMTNTQYRNKPQNTAHDLYTIDLDGTHVQRITQPGPISIVPDWKDNLILFTEFNGNDGYAGAVLINQDGSSYTRIKNGAFMPKWIP